MVRTTETIKFREVIKRAKGKVFEGMCALCRTDIFIGDLDSAILACGHMFHLGNEECVGLIGWLKKDGGCPLCRMVPVKPIAPIPFRAPVSHS